MWCSRRGQGTGDGLGHVRAGCAPGCVGGGQQGRAAGAPSPGDHLQHVLQGLAGRVNRRTSSRHSKLGATGVSPDDAEAGSDAPGGTKACREGEALYHRECCISFR